jgi:hypothetical protein
MERGMTPTPDNKKAPAAKIVGVIILIAIILLVIAIIATGVIPTSPPQEKKQTLSVLSLTPDRGAPGTTVPVTMGGMNFSFGPSPSVWLAKTGERNIMAGNVQIFGTTSMTFTLTIPLTAPAGQWDVMITGADGQFGSKTGAFTVVNDSKPLAWEWARDGWGDWQHGASCTGLETATGSCSEYGPVIVNGHGEHGSNIAPDLVVPTQSSVTKTFTAPAGTTWNTLTFNGQLSSSTIPDARWMEIWVNGAKVFYANATRTPPGNGQPFTITGSFRPANTAIVKISSGQDPTFEMSLYTMQFNSLTLS